MKYFNLKNVRIICISIQNNLKFEYDFTITYQLFSESGKSEDVEKLAESFHEISNVAGSVIWHETNSARLFLEQKLSKLIVVYMLSFQNVLT